MAHVHNPFTTATPAAQARSVRTLLAATTVAILLYFIPYAGIVTYPLRLLVTYIHEGSHALASLLTGGHVASIAINPDGSGLTYTAGGIGLAVASAGYLGAMAYGAAIIGALRRGVPGRNLLLLTGVLVGFVSLGVLGGLFYSGNVFGLFWGVLITGGLVIASRKLSADAAGWFAAFLGVQCVLNALFDLKTLFSLSWMGAGVGNDAVNMARMTLIPAPVWASLWILMSFGMLWLVLRPSKPTSYLSR